MSEKDQLPAIASEEFVTWSACRPLDDEDQGEATDSDLAGNPRTAHFGEQFLKPGVARSILAEGAARERYGAWISVDSPFRGTDSAVPRTRSANGHSIDFESSSVSERVLILVHPLGWPA